MKKTSIVASVVIIAVVVVLAASYVIIGNDGDDGDAHTGTWYTTDDYTCTDEILHTEFEMKDKIFPLTISEIDSGVLIGTYDSVPVTGGIDGDRFYLAYYQPSTGYEHNLSGRFLDDDTIYLIDIGYRNDAPGDIIMSSSMLTKDGKDPRHFEPTTVQLPTEYDGMFNVAGVGDEAEMLGIFDMELIDHEGGIMLMKATYGNEAFSIPIAIDDGDSDNCMRGITAYFFDGKLFTSNVEMSANGLVFISTMVSNMQFVPALAYFYTDWDYGQFHPIPELAESFTARMDYRSIDGETVTEEFILHTEMFRNSTNLYTLVGESDQGNVWKMRVVTGDNGEYILNLTMFSKTNKMVMELRGIMDQKLNCVLYGTAMGKENSGVHMILTPVPDVHVGTWNTIYEGECKESIKLSDHKASEGFKPLVIDSVIGGVFRGTYEGQEVIGCLDDDILSFSMYNPSTGYTSNFSGNFYDENLLYLSCISFRAGSTSVHTWLLTNSDQTGTIDPAGVTIPTDYKGVSNVVYDDDGKEVPQETFDMTLIEFKAGISHMKAERGNEAFDVYMIIKNMDSDGCLFLTVVFSVDGKVHTGIAQMCDGKLTFSDFIHGSDGFGLGKMVFETDWERGMDYSEPSVESKYLISCTMVPKNGFVNTYMALMDIEYVSEAGFVIRDAEDGDRCYLSLITHEDETWAFMVLETHEHGIVYGKGTVSDNGTIRLYGSSTDGNAFIVALSSW
ncbi:MAG: hypothetical protein ACI38Y_04835 [Candidatus Methanomethylophilaceae archaeon]